MTKYFRITGYCPEENFCFIIDSNGMFEKLWQFSSFVLQKKLIVLEVSNDEKFLDVNINKVKEDKDHMMLQITATGMPEYINYIINNVTYKAIKVADKIYIPNKEQII